MEDHKRLSFLDYNKISDTLMWFTKEISLKFCTSLIWRSENNNIGYSHFHAEYNYNFDGRDCKSINRIIRCYFTIDNKNDYKDGIMIGPKDIIPFNYFIEHNIMPWIVSDKLYSMVDNNLVITGKYKQQDFPLSETKYLSFVPIVIQFQDRTSCKGLRMVMNKSSNFIDITVDKFMEFYYYIKNTDMYCAASEMLNYVKTQPYGEGTSSFPDHNNFGGVASVNFFNSKNFNKNKTSE